MRFCALFFSVLFSAHLSGISIKVIRHNPVLHGSTSYVFEENSESLVVENLHRNQLIPPQTNLTAFDVLKRQAAPMPKNGETTARAHFAQHDAEQADVSFFTRKVRIQNQEITRSIPIINRLPVEGADGILSQDDHESPIFAYTHFSLPKARFLLNAAEAMEIAQLVQTKSILQNPYVEKIAGLYEPLWLMHFGELRPAFKTRLPTLSMIDLKDVYVDAETGDILKIDDAAYFAHAPADAFVYSPDSHDHLEASLKPVFLKDLIEVKEGDFMKGKYLSVRTCCKYFTCPSDENCTEDNMRCALKSHSNAQQRRETISLPTASLGLDPLLTLPKTITVDTVRCAYLPFARASRGNNGTRGIGFFEEPLDEPGLESEMDRFSEIQAYFAMTSFFKNIRRLLNDNTWCLRSQAMSCDENGNPILNDAGMPLNPYRIFVNQMIPDMKLSGPNQSDPENFIVQILAGKGSPEKPVTINSFTRIGNAAFVPSLNTIKASTPRADEILSDLIKPYDHNVFFQGDRDFAYDGDVVFHEFMHAITTSMVGKLNSLGLSSWGINSEPGSLNEGWSDYFAAALSKKPVIGTYAAVAGGYGEVSLRSIDNHKSCPNDVNGEVHNDAQVWSGALWELRQEFEKRGGEQATLEFDRCVLTALAKATISEDFKTQSPKLIEAIRRNALLGEAGAQLAEIILQKRGLTNCFRAANLSIVDKKNQVKTKVKDLLFVPSRNQIGLKNYAPSSSQLEIGVPAGAKSLEISWRQYLGGTGALLGTETTPDSTSNIEPLAIIASLDDPIKWRFRNAIAIPMHNEEVIQQDNKRAFYKNGLWHAVAKINLDRCEQRTMYISFLSYDFKYMLENISVSFDMDKSDNRSDCDFTGTLRTVGVRSQIEGCSTQEKTNHFALCALVLLAAIRRLRSKRTIV